MDLIPYGLAKVERQASSFPSCFINYRAHHCAQVTDIPAGQIVFCLPFIDSDVHWRAVILNVVMGETEYARLSWVHPDCLRPLGSENVQPIVKVGLTEGRGRTSRSIDIGRVATGVREVNDELVLDARWRVPLPRSTQECTGHCLSLCHSVIQEPECFATILRFAAAVRGRRLAHVCCAHAKHRSVAAANLLRLCFGVSVDFGLAIRDRSDGCCRERAADHVPCLLGALRSLPVLSVTASRSLAHILRLPE